ncbi:hypothetical protein Xcc3_37490 [Xanthomonas campestris pv. campestris]|nr:hypothetical protein Xcc3_37490 [Xanthomonas campestris pv. campestris]
MIDLRHFIALEFDVDDRADDLNDLALTHLDNSTNVCSILVSGMGKRDSGMGRSSAAASTIPDSPFPIPGYTAAAPLTISEISWVIAAWRALL